jgi:hypothetical protein
VVKVGVVVAIVKAAPLCHFFDNVADCSLFGFRILFGRLCHVVLGVLGASSGFLDVRVIIRILAGGRRLTFFYWDLFFFIVLFE